MLPQIDKKTSTLNNYRCTDNDWVLAVVLAN